MYYLLYFKKRTDGLKGPVGRGERMRIRMASVLLDSYFSRGRVWVWVWVCVIKAMGKEKGDLRDGVAELGIGSREGGRERKGKISQGDIGIEVWLTVLLFSCLVVV